uniref:Mif2/CENP-C cupin domain-containing protein n=1 Tax=Electrophorus electricus TaxID=8005 RepID=A0A4W4GW15_ELEEL
SESGTPLLSPSPKSAGLVEQVSTSHSPEMKPPSPFGAEVSILVLCTYFAMFSASESPFKVIAPIKTSSPINMAVVGSGARNPEQPDPSPLAFRGEEKEPVEGDLRLPPFNQLLMSPNKLLQGSPSLPPAEVLQGSHSDPLPQEQCKDQGQEVKVDAEVKKWSFQQQLKNALQPKASCFRKPESQKRPVRAPSPIELDDYDDFMILEDDTPILFTIPRKSESSQKGKMAPEVRKSNPTKVSEVKQAALKPTDEAKSCKDEPRAPKLPTLKKGGKTCSKNTGTVAQEALAESVESLGANEEVAVCEQISCPSPQATQDADLPSRLLTGIWSYCDFITKVNFFFHIADKKASKQPTTKQAASERLTKVTKVKTKEDLKRTQCTVPECDFSTEGPATGRRKRKPPGEWWLAPQSESLTREQEEVVHQSLQLKSHKKVKRKEIPSRPADSAKDPFPRTVRDSPTGPQNTVAGGKVAKKGKKPHADELKSNSAGHQKNPKRAHGKRKPKMVTANQCAAPAKMISMTPAPVVGEEVEGCAALEQLSSVAGRRMFDQIYTRDNQSGAAQKCRQSPLHGPETVPGKRQRKAPGTWWEVLPSQTSPDSSCPPLNCSLSKPIPQKDHRRGTSVVSSQKMPVRAQKTNKRSMINTPKSVRRSLATFNSILASAKAEASIVRGLRRKGCRNLLHSLEEQSEHSSEIVHSDGPQNASGNATYDVCVSAVTMEPVTGRKKMDARLSAGSRVSDHDIGFKSGPSSMIELERFEEEEDSDLPSSQIIRHLRHVPRVLADCDLCGPPLRPIVLEPEDWDNLCVWLSHLWPSSSKNGRVISPDDFHWHAYGGRGMGHTVDLQNNTFSNGKILLGSFMKKPPQVDLNAVTVFNVVSSCVRVEIDGIMTVYNSGQTFVTPCGQSYSIHNICREPAILWYNRMLPNHSRN